MSNNKIDKNGKQNKPAVIDTVSVRKHLHEGKKAAKEKAEAEAKDKKEPYRLQGVNTDSQ